MILAHAVRFHKARDWIRLQDQTTFIYQSLLNHCKLLEQGCKHYQKAQLKGRAQLTILTAATSTTSPVHPDAITTYPRQKIATDMDIITPEETAQPQIKDVSTVIE